MCAWRQVTSMLNFLQGFLISFHHFISTRWSRIASWCHLLPEFTQEQDCTFESSVKVLIWLSQTLILSLLSEACMTAPPQMLWSLILWDVSRRIYMHSTYIYDVHMHTCAKLCALPRWVMLQCYGMKLCDSWCGLLSSKTVSHYKEFDAAALVPRPRVFLGMHSIFIVHLAPTSQVH